MTTFGLQKVSVGSGTSDVKWLVKGLLFWETLDARMRFSTNSRFQNVWHNLKHWRPLMSLKFHRAVREEILSSFKLCLYHMNTSGSQRQQALQIQETRQPRWKRVKRGRREDGLKIPWRVTSSKSCFNQLNTSNLCEWDGLGFLEALVRSGSALS